MPIHDQPLAHETCRAETNRRNAQHSTGPRTAEGKSHSAQNAFKHGLYSKQVVQPGEDSAEFDELRATLRREHEPANTTEEILVDELAQHFWRLRRFREMEARAWAPDTVNDCIETGLLTLVTRAVGSAERGFFRTLNALAKLQKARGFVPSKTPTASDTTSLHQPTAEHDTETNCHSATHDDTDLLRPASSAQPPRQTQGTPSCTLFESQPSHQPGRSEMASFLK